MISLPTLTEFRPGSTSTAYTTGKLVVDNAVPAINEALVVHPSNPAAISVATTNGGEAAVTERASSLAPIIPTHAQTDCRP
jgi:hypothetical protein